MWLDLDTILYVFLQKVKFWFLDGQVLYMDFLTYYQI